MRVWLLPRLPLSAARTIYREALERRSFDYLTLEEICLNHREFASVGSQIEAGLLHELRANILIIAQQCGYPNGDDRQARRRFDQECSKLLADCAFLATGEALRDDVWSFFTLGIVPDVNIWRWKASKDPEDRFIGGVRNGLQRLWMRGSFLDGGIESPEGRWKVLDSLTEDAFVQIFERPSISASRKIARALGIAWVRSVKQIGSDNMESIFRNAIKQVLVRNEIQALDALSEARLVAEFASLIQRSLTIEIEEV